jgi:1-pyrroline-5-carboxylate dehydrogenase
MLGRHYPLLVGDAEIGGDETIISTNPARPTEVIGTHASANADTARAAIEVARHAFSVFGTWDPEDRQRALQQVADSVALHRVRLAALLTYEVGKSFDEADGEIDELVFLLRFYADSAVDLARSTHDAELGAEHSKLARLPLGVGAVIGPWNFPMALTGGMIAAALATGNAVVVKPSSRAPISVHWLIREFTAGHFPSGTVNLIPGPGDRIGDVLVGSPDINFLAFVGSKATGLRILARAASIAEGQRWIKRCILEMGGKNAVVVDETADLALAARCVVKSAFGYQGQKCSAASRLITVDAVHDELVDLVVKETAKLRVGDPDDPSAEIGPVIDNSAMSRVLQYVELASREANLAIGGRALNRQGFFIEPAVVDGVSQKSRLAQDEIFGPLLSVIHARDVDSAIAIANDVEYGLTASFFSTDRSRIEQASKLLEVGNLYINRECTGAIPGLHPFGGTKLSGTNEKTGTEDYLSAFVQTRTIGERRLPEPTAGKSPGGA